MSKWIKKLTEAYSEVNMNENKKMANAKALAKATASSDKGRAAVTLPKAPFDIPKKAEKMPIPKKDVNELNKSTLKSYIKKAHNDSELQRQLGQHHTDMAMAAGQTKDGQKQADLMHKHKKRVVNRSMGIATAADKLAKEAMDPVNHKALKGKHKDRDDTDIDNDGDTDSSDKYLHKRRKAISKNIKGGDEVEMNPKKKKDKGASTANADAEMAESTMPSVYARILENRAAHYKKAAPAQDKEDGMAPMTKKAKADMEAGAKMDDTEEKGHVDAAKAGRAGPGRKPRRNDNMKGDKAIIPSATKVKEAFAQVYNEAKLPGAFTLGDHAGHTFYGTKKQNHPDGSATLKLKLRSSHATDKDGAHKYATKAADKLKAKGYNVHKVSVRKSESGFGEAEHTASIHLSHNVKESTIQEYKAIIPSATKMKEAFAAVYEHVKPLKDVDHDTIKDSNSEHGDHMDIGHGAHEIEHPEEGGRGSSSPSHPHAYAHHDKKTGKVSAIQIKHQKTNPAAVAKGFGHKEVTNAHRAIADIHNGINTPDVKGGPKGAASMGHQDYDKHGNNTDLAK